MFQPRRYRSWVKSGDLVSFRIVENETDLLISVDKSAPLEAVRRAVRDSVSYHRARLKEYISRSPEFLSSLSPVDPLEGAPEIALRMIEAARRAGVGPMAAVAGAIAELVGEDLLRLCREVIVENGGDIFIKASKPRLVGLYAGGSPFTGRIAFKIDPEETPLGVCTSSGTVGHSLSFGAADSVTVFSESATLADAAATAIGNLISSPRDIERGIQLAKSIKGVRGVAIVVGDRIGIWGDVEIVKTEG